MKTVTFELTGVAPLLMHNGHLVDPTNSYAKQLKELTGKRKKTEADLLIMSEIEFKGGLYLDENLQVVVPGEVVEATIINGAKKSKEGTTAKMAMFVSGQYPLEYDGPKDVQQLWEDKRFVFVKPVKIGMSKIMRTRPIFKNWKVTIDVQYNEDLANLNQVKRWVKDAGEQVGLGDWRPKNGRFSAKIAK
jgi:hypothetical protein